MAKVEFLTGCAFVTGVFDGMYGEFGANIVGNKISGLLRLNGTATNVTVSVLSVAGLIASLGSYFSYDFSIARSNARHMASNLSLHGMVADRSRRVTIGLVSWIGFFSASQVIFTTPSALASLPYVSDIFSEHTIEVTGELAGIFPYMTVIAWAPTILKIFSPSVQPAIAHEDDSEPMSFTMIRIISILAGLIDSGMNSGFGVFLAMLVSLNEIFDLEYLSPTSLILSVLAGLSQFLLNGANIEEGYSERMASLREAWLDGEEQRVEETNVADEIELQELSNHEENIRQENDYQSDAETLAGYRAIRQYAMSLFPTAMAINSPVYELENDGILENTSNSI